MQKTLVLLCLLLPLSALAESKGNPSRHPPGCESGGCPRGDEIVGARIDAKSGKIVFKALKTRCNFSGYSLRPLPASSLGNIRNHFELVGNVETKQFCPLRKPEIVELSFDIPKVENGQMKFIRKNLYVDYKVKNPLVDETLTVHNSSKEKQPVPIQGDESVDEEGSASQQ